MTFKDILKDFCKQGFTIDDFWNAEVLIKHEDFCDVSKVQKAEINGGKVLLEFSDKNNLRYEVVGKLELKYFKSAKAFCDATASLEDWGNNNS